MISRCWNWSAERKERGRRGKLINNHCFKIHWIFFLVVLSWNEFPSTPTNFSFSSFCEVKVGPFEEDLKLVSGSFFLKMRPEANAHIFIRWNIINIQTHFVPVFLQEGSHRSTSRHLRPAARPLLYTQDLNIDALLYHVHLCFAYISCCIAT